MTQQNRPKRFRQNPWILALLYHGKNKILFERIKLLYEKNKDAFKDIDQAFKLSKFYLKQRIPKDSLEDEGTIFQLGRLIRYVHKVTEDDIISAIRTATKTFSSAQFLIKSENTIDYVAEYSLRQKILFVNTKMLARWYKYLREPTTIRKSVRRLYLSFVGIAMTIYANIAISTERERPFTQILTSNDLQKIGQFFGERVLEVAMSELDSKLYDNSSDESTSTSSGSRNSSNSVVSSSSDNNDIGTGSDNEMKHSQEKKESLNVDYEKNRNI